jgi:hypothetical protein
MPHLIAEYVGREGRLQVRLWLCDRNVFITSFDLDRVPATLMHFPRNKAEAHRWARRLVR